MARRGPAPDALAQALSSLRIFPLQGVVAFPRAPTPFHIFEPRYRQLVAEALATDRMLAVATIAEAEEAPFQQEPVRPIACAGFIEDHELLADGRYHVLVRGLARVRLERELATDRPFRTFRAHLVEDVMPAGGPAALEDDAQALEQLLIEIAQGLPAESGAPQLAAEATRLKYPGALADLAAAALVTDADARYAILAEPDVKRRLAKVTEETAAVVLALTARKGPMA